MLEANKEISLEVNMDRIKNMDMTRNQNHQKICHNYGVSEII
jgi:hypothetical protein